MELSLISNKVLTLWANFIQSQTQENKLYPNPNTVTDSSSAHIYTWYLTVKEEMSAVTQPKVKYGELVLKIAAC